MTVKVIILILLCTLLGCKNKNDIDLELVSYNWLMKNEVQNRTLTPYLKCNLYAQINREGDCVLTKTRYLKSDLRLNFTIEKKILDPVFEIIENLSADTIMIQKSFHSIYDGASIKLIGTNNKGIVRSVKFDQSNRSNNELLKFYNYIDSISISFAKKDLLNVSSM